MSSSSEGTRHQASRRQIIYQEFFTSDLGTNRASFSRPAQPIFSQERMRETFKAVANECNPQSKSYFIKAITVLKYIYIYDIDLIN